MVSDFFETRTGNQPPARVSAERLYGSPLFETGDSLTSSPQTFLQPRANNNDWGCRNLVNKKKRTPRSDCSLHGMEPSARVPAKGSLVLCFATLNVEQ